MHAVPSIGRQGKGGSGTDFDGQTIASISSQKVCLMKCLYEVTIVRRQAPVPRSRKGCILIGIIIPGKRFIVSSGGAMIPFPEFSASPRYKIHLSEDCSLGICGLIFSRAGVTPPHH